ncbi:hypothetical protein PRZ48_014910 [Zasmidium cellare]|uniref:Fungal N-terminal domain-containing protein n=1 Tax=Zasmidium cellare TaxID=395010 RepID=A0ABR0DX34_ZASCE|nr:hypothetical protein PRZ48_014910 [Zasmidium cellare]
MAAPFGFSVGDVIAGCRLAIRTGEALMNAAGASAEYKATIADLQMFQHTLERIQGLQSTRHEDVVLQRYAKQCCRPIVEFLDKMRDYETALVPGKDQKRSTRAILRRAPKQVKWAILVQEDVAKVRNEVGARLAVINTHLALSPRPDMIRTEGTVSIDSYSVKNVEAASDTVLCRGKANPGQRTTAAAARHIKPPPLLTITSGSFTLTVGPDALRKPEKTLESLVAILMWIYLPGTYDDELEEEQREGCGICRDNSNEVWKLMS